MKEIERFFFKLRTRKEKEKSIFKNTKITKKYMEIKKRKKKEKKYFIRESKTRMGKLGEDEGKLVIKDKGHCLQKCFGEL